MSDAYWALRPIWTAVVDAAWTQGFKTADLESTIAPPCEIELDIERVLRPQLAEGAKP